MQDSSQNDQTGRRKFIFTGSLAVAGLASYAAGLPVFATQQQTLRIGVIGTGSRGTGVVSIIKGLPGIQITACCDTYEPHLRNALKQVPAAKSYSDYRTLIQDKNVDAVIITLPLHLHYDAAVAALDNGKHVYLEKTMTYDIPEAEKLVKKVRQHPELIFQVGHQYRYFNLYHKIAEMIGKGWLGEVHQYECQYHRNADWRRPVSDPTLARQLNWRMYKAYSGGLMAELCAHQIDIVNWLTGSHPLRITAIGGIDYWKDGRETFDNIRSICEYPNGVKATFSSILSNAYKGYSIRILGTKATIEVQQSKAFYYGEGANKELTTVDGVSGATADSWGQGKPVPVAFRNQDSRNLDPTAYAVLDFAECIRMGKKPFSNIETGYDAAVTVHLANQSAETGMMQQWT